MGVIITHGTGTTTTAGASGSGAINETEKLALEMEMEFKTANESYYKEFDYSPAGDLIDIDIWTDSTKTSKLFHKDLFYDSNENLERTLLNRISDGSYLLKIFAYVSGNLDSVTVSAG